MSPLNQHLIAMVLFAWGMMVVLCNFRPLSTFSTLSIAACLTIMFVIAGNSLMLNTNLALRQDYLRAALVDAAASRTSIPIGTHRYQLVLVPDPAPESDDSEDDCVDDAEGQPI